MNDIKYTDYGISLYGNLGRAFTRKYKRSAKNIKIKCDTIKDVIFALDANFPGFRKLFRKFMHYRVVNGKTLLEGNHLSKEEIELKQSKRIWHIMPVAECCGGNGILTSIIGIVLMVVGYVLSPYTGGASLVLTKIGAAVLFAGISQMLSPSPNTDYGNNEKPAEKPSYLFDGPTNSVEPGLARPLVYGEVFIGSVTVSGGVRIVDIEV